jgi:hypothetical protein
MASARLTLRDGTIVTIKGSTEEIKAILMLHQPGDGQRVHSARHRSHLQKKAKTAIERDSHIKIIEEQVKECNDFDVISSNILDARARLPKILLPLYIVERYLDEKNLLTSGEISCILRELGVRIDQPDVSKLLATDGSKYVVGDKTREKGSPVRYKILRRGVEYIEGLLRK